MAVVIPAGGAGVRMGGPRKQFRLLGGLPVLVHALRACAGAAAVGWRVVAVPEDGVASAEDLLGRHGLADVRVVAGGPTRQASVARALAAVPGEAAFVLVHDAVRPFLSPDVLARVLAAVREVGAAAPAVPVADTLRSLGRDRRLGATHDRDALVAMQTPQGARADWLRDAYARAERSGLGGTDDVALLQAAGYPVAAVEGDARLFKLTRPEDFALAEALLPVWGAALARSKQPGAGV
ncbi:MAG: 2-C-methyl-D-erythritol 4-phosphate cytidylyltransferase [Rubricoccaceae bacterium]